MPPVESSYDKFLQFRSVVIQAIAKAWQDEAFHEQLKLSPKVALKEAFDYDFPFNLDLKTNDDNAAWDQTEQGGWLVYEQNDLEMILPPPPAPEQEAVALAAYNAQHISFLE